jgi:hypothetical protein
VWRPVFGIDFPNIERTTMQIQINTNIKMPSHELMATWVQTTLTQTLSKFAESITRLEVHLSDENGDKNGPHDQRCMLEARLKGRQPVVVTELAASLEQAVTGAGHKMVRLLESD